MNDALFLVANKVRALLEHRGPMTRRDLQMATRGRDWTTVDFNEAVNQLLASGKIRDDGRLLSVVDNSGIVDQWSARRAIKHMERIEGRCPCCGQMLNTGS